MGAYSSISSLRDQPTTLVRRYLIFLDRARNGYLLIGRIVDNADELRGRSLDVVNGPGVCLFAAWLLGHLPASSRPDRATSVDRRRGRPFQDPALQIDASR